ncbi:alpha/beta hydrolase [Dactylosporangium sp. NPDC049140]|uniref:alpha/beta hydrolase n=1 Tax=Dactylosporangium sp. NPDC049140 TaxID=3155647 RepID=UPI0033CA5231
MRSIAAAHAGPRTTFTGRLRGLLIAVPLLTTAILALTPAPAQASRPACQRYDTSVTLVPDATVRYRVAGWLCRPSRPTGTVQILLSGFTYDHRYWGLPGDDHAYAQAAIQAGMAVYTVDRIGVGASDRPPAEQVTVTAEAFVTHQLVQQLRHGNGWIRRVVGVGHSYGSAIFMVEAAGHHDVDALILTGYLHRPNPVQQAAIAAGLHPAHQDPAFAGERPPDGYVTTTPGTRGGDFFYLPGAARDAVASDERAKATGTTGERATMNLARDPSYSQHITVPVLVVVGDHDTLNCDAAAGLRCGTAGQICARERGFYPPSSPLYAAVIPAPGHSINGHRTAALAYALANAWAGAATSGLATFWPQCPA